MLSRRSLIIQLSTTALVGALMTRTRWAAAADKSVKIGINLPFTGADAHDAELIKDGALLAIDEANAQGGVAGYKIEVLLLDDGTATAGQYDPAQAATNARKLVSNPSVVANVGPQNSGSGKAMAPILSQGNLATITPSSTNPDITDPKFAPQFRPAGKAIYFRTVTTDAYQGPNMANYFAPKLKVKKVFIIDDTGAYGVGIADAFEAQARKDGMTVLGHDRSIRWRPTTRRSSPRSKESIPRHCTTAGVRWPESKSSSSPMTCCQRSSKAAAMAFTAPRC